MVPQNVIKKFRHNYWKTNREIIQKIQYSTVILRILWVLDTGCKYHLIFIGVAAEVNHDIFFCFLQEHGVDAVISEWFVNWPLIIKNLLLECVMLIMHPPSPTWPGKCWKYGKKTERNKENLKVIQEKKMLCNIRELDENFVEIHKPRSVKLLPTRLSST